MPSPSPSLSLFSQSPHVRRDHLPGVKTKRRRDAGSEPATAPDRARDDTRRRRPLVPPSAVASVAHFPVLIALQTTNHGERQPRAGSRGCENLCNHLTFCGTELERCGRAAQAAKPTYRSRSFICRRTGKRRQRTKFGRLRRAITVVVGDDSRRRRR